MRRPSHWILLSTAVAAVAYAVLHHAAPEPSAPLEPADGPVVVRRSGAESASSRATFEGRVVDRLGWPLAGAVVRLVAGGAEAVSDAAGEFRIEVPSFRRHRVRIAAAGHQPLAFWMRPVEQRTIVLEDALPWTTEESELPGDVDDGLVGEGFLQDAAGAPVAYGSVTVVETGVRETADENGRFRIALPESPATLLAWDRRGRVARGDPIPAARKQGLVPLPDLVLVDGLALRGYLSDADGKPSAAAALTLRGCGIVQQILTDASGGFAFTGLLEGTYVLEALPHRGSLGLRRQLTVGAKVVDLDLSLIARRSLSVVVKDAGTRPVPGVWVLAEEGDLRRAHAQTDAHGRAELAGVGPGPFAFEVRESTPERRRYEILGYDEDATELTVR